MHKSSACPHVPEDQASVSRISLENIELDFADKATQFRGDSNLICRQEQEMLLAEVTDILPGDEQGGRQERLTSLIRLHMPPVALPTSSLPACLLTEVNVTVALTMCV